MADTLAEFLTARLGEKQRYAQDLAGPHGPRYASGMLSLSGQMLREVQAGRKILALHVIRTVYEHVRDADDRLAMRPESDCDVCGWAGDTEGTGCQTLRIAAAVHDGHPDYDEAWRP